MRVLELFAGSECVSQRLQDTPGLVCPQGMDTKDFDASGAALAGR
jgi:hypothetical protein